METRTKPQSDQDTELIGSRLDRMDPGIFRNQRSPDDEPDVDANGINDDVLMEEKVEAGDIGTEKEE